MSDHSPQADWRSDPSYRPGLHAFAVLFVILTFTLIGLRGTVTSHGAGMSVPDWPRSFGFSMLSLPWEIFRQTGVIFEHSHRLLGSLVGALCLVLMLWLWFTQGRRPWLRGLGLVVLGLVIVQGVLGGIRVTQTSIPLAIVHGVLGQIFLCSTVLVAAATSRKWLEKNSTAGQTLEPAAARSRKIPPALLRLLAMAMLGALLVQLTLGAGMRHTGSGLAIPDFPTSFGRLIPPINRQDINAATDLLAHQAVISDSNGHAALLIPTPSQVGLAFSHRFGAMVVLILGLWLIAQAMRSAATTSLLRGPALALLVLLLTQAALGAAVIWTGRQPEITTAHQATGAATLAVAFLLTLRIFRFGTSVPAQQISAAPDPGSRALEGSLA